MAETDRGIGSHHIDVTTAALVSDVNPFAADQGDGWHVISGAEANLKVGGFTYDSLSFKSARRSRHASALICRNGWRKKRGVTFGSSAIRVVTRRRRRATKIDGDRTAGRS